MIVQVAQYDNNGSEEQNSRIIQSKPIIKNLIKAREQNAIVGQVAKVLNWSGWLEKGTNACKQYHNKLENVSIQTPFYYSEWIKNNHSREKFGKCFEPNIECYRDLRASSGLPKYLDQIETGITNKTLILDLDETLVHSSFTPVEDVHIVLPITIENNISNIYVQVRPGAKYFLEEASKLFEVVVFTASLSKYAEPLMEKLDPSKFWTFKLFREHWSVWNSSIFIKDLAFLGREMKNVIIIDNSPNSYAFHTENALPIPSWYGSSGKPVSWL